MPSSAFAGYREVIRNVYFKLLDEILVGKFAGCWVPFFGAAVS